MSATRLILMAVTIMSVVSGGVRAQFPATISPPAALNGNAGSDAGSDITPQLVSDGQGHWVAVWRSNANLGGITGTDTDIFVARSSNNGATWTLPALLNANGSTDSPNNNDSDPQLVTDGLGHWVAAWSSNTALSGSGTDIDIHCARSTDNGATWTDPAPLNTDAENDSRGDGAPHIATDAHGNWVAVWGADVGTADLYSAHSSDNGATWSAPMPFAIDSHAEQSPRLATDGQGTWLAVWHSDKFAMGTDVDIGFARSTDNGATWTPPAPLNTNAASDSGFDGSPDIASDGHGHWIAIWGASDLSGVIGPDGDIFVAHSHDNGTTWSPPAPLNPDAVSDTRLDAQPNLATDTQGRWVATWHVLTPVLPPNSPTIDVVVSASTDDGATWTGRAGLNVKENVDPHIEENAVIATDRRGNWIGVWQSDDDLGGTIATDFDILTARFALPDCNGNGVGDGQDIADGTSIDCDANGVPDECDLDSDADDVIDPCDNCPTAANADQADSDRDGVGDACQAPPPPPPPAACGTCAGRVPRHCHGLARLPDRPAAASA